MTKDWIDRRWDWLVQHVGGDLAHAPTILPTAEFFPDVYDKSEDAVQVLLKRVCG